MESFDFGVLGWKLLFISSLFDIVLTISGLSFFLTISWAVWKHFSSERMPTGMRLISIASFVSIAIFVNDLWALNQNHANSIIGIIVHIMCFTIFLASVHVSTKQRISLAFDCDTPTFLIKDGIYQYIRHPFYLSYIIFWYGNYLITTSIYCLISAVVMSIIYIYAIQLEEKKFEDSVFSKEYSEYKDRVGMLIPRFFSNG